MIGLAAAKMLPWKTIGLAALGMFILSLMLALSMERRQNDKLKANVEKLSATLRSISDAKDRQGKETDRNISKARERIITVDREARKIEVAPLPGNCRTPDAVMGSDL